MFYFFFFQAVLVEHSSKPTLVLEINPQYLVPDTNCFIDHLPDLQYIVESKDFTIVIPLVGKFACVIRNGG